MLGGQPGAGYHKIANQDLEPLANIDLSNDVYSVGRRRSGLVGDKHRDVAPPPAIRGFDLQVKVTDGMVFSDRLAHAAEALGAREVRLADEAEFADTFADCDLGAMPPFGNLYGLPVYVDATLAEDETIYFQAGTHTDTMSLEYADFARLVQPSVADFARHARAVGNM